MDSYNFPVYIQTMSILAPNVTIYYPRVEGLKNKAVQEKINVIILHQVYALIQEQGYYQNPTTIEMLGHYEIKSNERDILSLTLENYAYILHHAHGLTILKSLTINIQTGKLYQLKDLFQQGSDYIKRLSNIIQFQIKKRNIPLLGEFKGIRPDQDFYIADKALVIYFQLYEITPYYVGFPMFPISVYDLEDIINENGPLGKMAQA
ncbi:MULTISPECIES: DUF3298 and DUF4163 domain-containing protein [Aneurinibacillus]|uniref:DUF3298 and DUF4163 domain-containing protein n=1 Tax=Aneurinibacillus thermoaerophilus TaxID=143495 RepID=A0A1G7WR83_ANETH|nr:MULTISPECIES: DUF3298 and DUF4163 domain-containing protein [Aneurinibacillus]AMA73999.1 hypothetical protein ACH33_14910 [Aneurinibacillus sp. XH2]MED0676255.1 DUF3298 domain-containing protein [Aneurinibacillus thermoaerophilus]MED0678186.1 DUF3298 domain-containing protein [Aneurinibacillus thermoaerophilus]MED0737627.1 DUF3298 domain-containing protein [Aneurinibacillus thermoaerophilus]MED0755619.1 DUF3298 domain-containing protein [Aneurinibacillus thermoaerophilus]